MTNLNLIINELHNELERRRVFFQRQIDEKKMTRDEANQRYLSLAAAKKRLEAKRDQSIPKFKNAKHDKPLNEICQELLREIGYRKKVYAGKLRKGEMTMQEVERKIKIVEGAYDLLKPQDKVEDAQLKIF